MEAVAILPPDMIERVAMINPRNMVPASPTIQDLFTSNRQKTNKVGIKTVKKERTKRELFFAARESSVM